MPSRIDFHPEELRYLLGYLLLYDVVAGRPVRYRYRVVGSEIAERRGFDMTGRFVDEHPELVAVTMIEGLNNRIVAERRPVWSPFGPLEGYIEARHCGILGLPLSSDGDTVDKILAAQIFLSRERRL